MRRCRHRWLEVKRYFVEPVPAERFDRKIPRHLHDEILHGFTMVELRCGSCSDVLGRKLQGDAT